MFALHFVAPGPRWLHPPLTWAGIPIVLAGMAISGAGGRSLADHGTTVLPGVRPEALVTDGPYRWSRNPMYLGMLVSLLGLAVFFGTLVPALVLPAFGAWLHVRFVRAEERALEERFGEPYRDWRARVRRWL